MTDLLSLFLMMTVALVTQARNVGIGTPSPTGYKVLSLIGEGIYTFNQKSINHFF